jgi:hypothetical protein
MIVNANVNVNINLNLVDKKVPHFFRLQSFFFCDLEAHATFWNPSTLKILFSYCANTRFSSKYCHKMYMNFSQLQKLCPNLNLAEHLMKSFTSLIFIAGGSMLELYFYRSTAQKPLSGYYVLPATPKARACNSIGPKLTQSS